jgi:hypothetical protein
MVAGTETGRGHEGEKREGLCVRGTERIQRTLDVESGPMTPPPLEADAIAQKVQEVLEGGAPHSCGTVERRSSSANSETTSVKRGRGAAIRLS